MHACPLTCLPCWRPPGLQGISPKRKKQLLAKLKANAAKVAVASK
jgi:hypothetical protein